MINFDKHTIRFCGGDINVDVLTTPSGRPVLAFSNKDKGIGKESMFMGFDNGESIDGLISILRSVRRSYFPAAKPSLSSTQHFRIED